MQRERGQSTIEFAVTFSVIIMPLTAAVIFTAQMLWTWHSVVDFTRQGARYASTHCWQGSGTNVANWMREHVPPMIDADQFRMGRANIEVQYFARNPETGLLEDFTCEGAECSTDCVPDAVTVQITGYEFTRAMTYLGVNPVPLPDFRTSLPMESAGCDPALISEGQTQCAAQ